MRREDRARILATLAERVVARNLGDAQNVAAVRRLITQSIDLELARLRAGKRSPRDDADSGFWRGAKLRLRFTRDAALPGLLGDIVTRYAEEVGGSFDPTLYRIATRLLPPALAVLLTGVSPADLLRRFPQVPDFADRVRLSGELEATRSLGEHGTLVLCPTHASNLDSIVLGLAAHSMELPPLVYGAGLNLLSNPLMSLFMHNFGAYTVDRDKQDPLYKEVLKEYTALTLENGYANLFFPGGTRSRSGAVEQRLKLGLLGTTVPALRNNLAAIHPRPGIFVVPVTLSFELVLEAESLIAGFLARELGGETDLPRDDSGVAEQIARFVESLVALDNRIDVVLGSAVDPLGHRVDETGSSRDGQGNPVDLEAALRDGEPDEVDREGTGRVGEHLAAAYLRDNVAKPTHLLARALFQELRGLSPNGDPRELLLERRETRLPGERVLSRLGRLRDGLERRARRGEVRLTPSLERDDPDSLAEKACETFASYHRQVPAARRDGGDFVLEERSLLFFYQNRLEGYGLDRDEGLEPLVTPDHAHLRATGSHDT